MRPLISPASLLSLCLFVSASAPFATGLASAQGEAAPPIAAQNEIAPANTLNARGFPLPGPESPDKTTNSAARNRTRRAQLEMRLRAMMSDFGIDESAQQDALIAYLAEDEVGKSSVRDAARRLMTAVKRGSTPARTREVIAVYKASLDADRERRHAAQNALDAKIGFSLNPRLEATLWLLGVLGDGQAVLPFNLVTPGSNNPRKNPPDEVAPMKTPVPVPQRTSVVTGNITKKGEGWIEVRDENGGTAERYLPFWAMPEAPINRNGDVNGNYDGALLDAMKASKVGDRVRLEWVWNERKRLVRFTVLPDVPPQNNQAEPVYPIDNPELQ